MENQEAIINKDGSVANPTLMSVEEAMIQSGVPVPESTQNEQSQVDAVGSTPTEGEPENTETPNAVEPQEASQQLEEKDISVGGITKKTSEWIQEFQSEDGIDISSLDPKAQETLLNHYLDSKNKSAWQKSLTEKNQAVADARKQTERILQDISRQEDRIDYSLEQVNTQIQRIQGYANLNIAKDDPNLYSDPDLQRQYLKMMDAREELPQLIQQKKQIEQSATQIAAKKIEAEFSLFQHSIGHYKTEAPISQLLASYSQNQLDYESPDFDKVQDLIDIAKHAGDRGLSFDNAYKDLKKLGRLRVKQEEKFPLPKPNAKSNTQSFVQSISRKQQGTQFLSGSATRNAVRPSAPMKSEGDLLKEASSRAMGRPGGEGLSKLGY